MKKLSIFTLVIILVLVSLPLNVRADSLDGSYWAVPISALNYAAGTIDFNVTSVPTNPYQVMWGKDLSVTKDKVYKVRFDAWADSYTSDPDVPISLKIHQKTSPWTWRSQEEIIELDGTLKSYEVELYATANDGNVILAVWTGWAAAQYHFENISVTEEDPITPIPVQPLDFSYWANDKGNINYGFGIITFDLPSAQPNPWDAIWGKNMEVVKDQIYQVKFDAKADSYTVEPTTISLRIVQNYAPWAAYTNEVFVDLTPTNSSYQFDLVARGNDSNAVLTVLLGYESAQYEFSMISVAPIDGSIADVRVVHASPDAPNVDVLVDDSPAFIDVGFSEVTNYSTLPSGIYNIKVVPTGTTTPAVINTDITLDPGEDYTVIAANWLQSIEPLVLNDDNDYPVPSDQAYVRFVHLSPDSSAVDVAVVSGSTLWSNVAFKEVGDYLLVDSGTYDLEVKVAGTDIVALSVPGVMFSGGRIYTVYAMGLVTPGPGLPELQAIVSFDAEPGAPTTLDPSYWAVPIEAIDYAAGTIDFNVTSVPTNPYQVMWGKDLSVTKDKVYKVRFDAWADSYTSDPDVPISLKIHQKTSPWTWRSQEEIIELDGTLKSYEVELYATANDGNVILAVWTGWAAAQYHFENISVTEEDPITPIPVQPLDFSYWANNKGSINYGFGIISFDLPSAQPNPWDAIWGKNMEVVNGRTYRVTFDAETISYTVDDPQILVRIVQNYSPYSALSQEEFMTLTASSTTYQFDLVANASDTNAVMTVQLGFDVAQYEFNMISVEELP